MYTNDLKNKGFVLIKNFYNKNVIEGYRDDFFKDLFKIV